MRLAVTAALAWSFSVGATTAEPSARTGGDPAKPADLVFLNGKIFTADTFSSVVQAVAITEGRFAAVGSDEKVRALIGRQTEVVDLKGAMVMPGITDMHVHPVRGGLAAISYCRFSDKLDQVRTLEAVKACVRDKPHGAWVEGAQWDAGRAESLDKAALDAVAPNNPVYLHDNTNHIVWVNSAALKAAGIDRDTPDPPGGVILRNPQNGEPTGVLLESAMALVHRAMPPPTAQEVERAAEWVFRKLNSFGVTSVQSAQGAAADHAAFRRLEADGRLTVRLKANWDFNTPLASAPPEQMLLAFDTREERGEITSLIDPDGAKIYADGIPAGGGSPYLEPYASSPTFGRPAIDQGSLNSAVLKFDGMGLSVMIHAMGDAAVRSALDAVEATRRANGWSGRRHIIAHTFSVSPDDMGRGRRLGVVFENSPPVVLFPNELTRNAVPLLGRQRVRSIAPLRSLIGAGDVVAYGSDWDNIPEPDPWLALQAMVTRQNPYAPHLGYLARAEAVDIVTGLEILTINGAYALGLEHRTGSNEEGKEADLIVLSQDLLRAPASDIHKTRVLRTVLQGRTVFTARP